MVKPLPFLTLTAYQADFAAYLVEKRHHRPALLVLAGNAGLAGDLARVMDADQVPRAALHPEQPHVLTAVVNHPYVWGALVTLSERLAPSLWPAVEAIRKRRPAEGAILRAVAGAGTLTTEEVPFDGRQAFWPPLRRTVYAIDPAVIRELWPGAA